jgi:hypothetical protein
MPADDLHKMLLSNGVKPEEMQWTGLDEFLKGKGKEKVTPQEMQEHLAGNNLQVQEVTKGRTDNRAAIEDLDKKIEEINHKFSVSNKSERDALFSEREALSEQRRNLVNTDYTGKDTKFGQYVLPGGKNYRELLLTMPRKEVTTGDVAQELFKKQMAELSDDERKQVADTMRQRGDNGARDFRSAHWDEPNVLGHVRFNDRTGPNGEKILHIEEAQSDWGQRIRREGGVRQEGELKLPETWKVWQPEAQKGFEQYGRPWQVLDDHGMIRGQGRSREAAEETALNTIDQMNRNLPPNMPFPKTWPELLLKRMVKYAVDHGYQGISWTPGEEQAERYDLSKQVDKIVVIPTEEGSRAVRIHTPTAGESIKLMVDKDGKVTPAFSSGNEFAGKHIADVVGKEVAEKIMSAPKETALTGVDLKVGGAGMKGFYDKIIPDAANKLGKQWGAKVGETKIGSSSENPYSQYEGPAFGLEDLRKIATDHTQNNHVRDEADAVVRAIRGGESYDKAIVKHGSAALAVELKGDLVAQKQTKTVPYLPITPEMRAGVKAIPYSLFSIPLAAGALSLAQIKEQADKLKKGAKQ